MTQSTCPHCGRSIGDAEGASATEPSPTPAWASTPADRPASRDLASPLRKQGPAALQAQLLQYAHELKRMAPYLSRELRQLLGEDDKSVEGQRRQVAVLVADLVNFTHLTGWMDPGEVFRLLNDCFHQLATHIFKHGGLWCNFLGDGIMVIFGASRSQSDDPAHAVQAALDMNKEMLDFGRVVPRQLGARLQLRTGISYGEVMAGNVTMKVGLHEQKVYTVVGRTVNLAFRLQTSAPPGAVLVDQFVQDATHEIYTYLPVEALEVKGFEGTVPAYRLVNRQEP